MSAVDAKVLYDKGSFLLVCPKRIPEGQRVRVGAPRNIEGTVTGHEPDGLTNVEIDKAFMPRRAVYAHDWLPDSYFGGSEGPLCGAEES